MASGKDSLLGTIIDFIARRKVRALERAFRNNVELVQAIKQLDRNYERMDKILDDFCQKYPEACEAAEKRRGGLH